MEAIIPALLAAFLAEWGDKTQLMGALLAARFGRPGAIIAGAAVAALAGSVLAAIGGSMVAGLATFRAVTLMLALALMFAGIGSLRPRAAAPRISLAGGGAFLSSTASFFLVEFGDKTQFLTFAIAARSASPSLAAAGATAGIMAGVVPAILLGSLFQRVVPVSAIRMGAAILLLLSGAVAALVALRLV